MIKLVIMKHSAAFYILLLVAMTACNNLQKPKQTLEQKQKELEAGKLDKAYTYTVDEVGWTVVLPENWDVMSKRENYDMTKRGRQLIEENSGQKVDDSKLIDLVSIKKKQYNIFQATMEPFDTTTDGDYDQASIAVHELITGLYKSKEVPFDQSLGAVRIDGIMFDRLEITVYSPDKKKVIIEQKIFNALINGYDFSMAISYNDTAYRKTLMGMVMNSKFSIK